MFSRSRPNLLLALLHLFAQHGLLAPQVPQLRAARDQSAHVLGAGHDRAVAVDDFAGQRHQADPVDPGGRQQLPCMFEHFDGPGATQQLPHQRLHVRRGLHQSIEPSQHAVAAVQVVAVVRRCAARRAAR